MTKPINLLGKSFGRLQVVSRAENDKNGKARWMCKCECGGETVVEAQNLIKGRVKSCGCLYNERKHGKSDTRLHRIWTGMKTRCHNPNHHEFYNYGGRGISVCDEWEKSFVSFYNWAVNNGYEESLTIDRIDNNKGYSPENCRWATTKEQNKNRNRTIRITYNGKTQTINEWADEVGINSVTLKARLTRYKWDVERALTEKTNKK